jgi:hypothetical protein
VPPAPVAAPPRSDPSIEDRARLQPCHPYAPATGPRAAHAAQHLPHRAVPAVEARQLRDGERALAVAPGSEAIDGQVEAGQLMERAGENGDPLATGGGVGGRHVENIARTRGVVEFTTGSVCGLLLGDTCSAPQGCQQPTGQKFVGDGCEASPCRLSGASCWWRFWPLAAASLIGRVSCLACGKTAPRVISGHAIWSIASHIRSQALRRAHHMRASVLRHRGAPQRYQLQM